MGKCKNIECENETNDKNVYCSLKCRNIYVNKYLRDYSKNSHGLSKDKVEKYELNPKYCKNINCGEKIPYENRRNDYCNHSCKASSLNHNRLGMKYVLSDIGLLNLRTSASKLHGVSLDIIEEYNKTPNKCCNCDSNLEFRFRKNKFCCRGCKTLFYQITNGGVKYYKSQTKFNFSLNDYPHEFDFNLISKYGWYSPSNSRKSNIGGVSRDHMLSVMDGFKLNIDPLLLSHPANCKLMIHSDNIRKHKKSSITLDELLIRILEWDYKYGKYTK